MELSGTSSAGMSCLDFEDVNVLVEYVLGEEDKAFPYIPANFQHVSVYQFCLDLSECYARNL